MEFHIARSLREKLKVDDLLFSYTGNVVFADVGASRRLALAMNQLHTAENGGVEDSARLVNAGQLFAMGLIDELSHAVVAHYRKQTDPEVLTVALQWLSAQAGEAAMDKLLLAFTERFPNSEVQAGKVTATQWLAGTTEGLPNREAAFEELMLLHLANSNPAFAPFRELFDDKGLAETTAYKAVVKQLPEYFATRPEIAPEIGTLLEALEAPMRLSPESLTAQLEYIRTHWDRFIDADLGSMLKTILLAIDTVKEEEIAVWMRFNPARARAVSPCCAGVRRRGFSRR